MFSCELPKDAPRTNPLTSIVSCGDLHLHPRPRRSCGVNAEVNEDPKLQESVVLESARAEMGEVREENEKLKLMLERVEKDYNSLRRHFLDLLASQATPATTTTGHDDEELSLCLGMSSSSSSTKEDFHRETTRTATTTSSGSKEDEVRDGSCLTLGRGLITILDAAEFPVDNLGSSDATTKNADREEVAKKDKEVVEAWDPSKARAKRVLSTEEDACKSDVETTPQQSQAKRARVCVRARCQTPTMNDGCHWRKYGQKIAKGNPCPRAYYRCTLAQSCPVRKQVQRCADDMSILITTYEGTHNHPVPAAATAMVSTTSAAASMLLSGSSSSSTSTSPQYYSTPSPLFSTVTLDLTTSTLPSTTPPSRLLHFPSNTSLSFASSSPPPSQPSGISNNGSHQQAAALTAETVTKALTSDPSFRTVIAAALTSMMNGSSSFGSPTTTMTTTATASHLGGGASSSLGIGFHSSSSSSSSYLPTSFPFNILNSASVSTATTNATSQE